MKCLRKSDQFSGCCSSERAANRSDVLSIHVDTCWSPVGSGFLWLDPLLGFGVPELALGRHAKYIFNSAEVGFWLV